MKVTQEKLPASQIGLEIEITPETTKQKYEEVIKNLSSTVSIPGFRKGKIPRAILLQRYGNSRIKAAALEEIIPHGIEGAVKQESIQAIGQPQLRSSFEDLVQSYQPGQPLTILAAVDVQPEINLTQYTDLKVTAQEVKFDPNRVDQVLDKERQDMATLIPVEGRAAQMGDVAVVDFQGVLVREEGEDESIPPTPIPGGSGTDFQVELQENQFIPGFVSGIIGMNNGETKEVSAQFPEDYANPALANKAAIFTITIKEIKEKELPELNDEFAQEISEFQTLGELRTFLEERYQQEAQEQTKVNQEEALLGELLNYVEVELPETWIQQELDSLLNQTATKLSQQGLDVKKLFSTPEIISQFRERSRPDAINRLKRGLALQEVSKRESIQVKDEEIHSRVTELLKQYTEKDIDAEQLSSIVANELATEKTLNWLLENSSVELLSTEPLISPEPLVEAD